MAAACLQASSGKIVPAPATQLQLKSEICRLSLSFSSVGGDNLKFRNHFDKLK